MINIFTDARASAEILEMEAFWGDKFRRGYGAALAHLQRLPRGGHPYPHRRYPGCLRVRIKGCKAYLYYVYDGKAQTITILTVWGQSRGKGPFDR